MREKTIPHRSNSFINKCVIKSSKHNEQYHSRANQHEKQILYEEGDFVWIHLGHESFPARRFGKLKPRGDDPFRVLQRINDNTYKIKLPGHYNVYTVFNVADLFQYLREL